MLWNNVHQTAFTDTLCLYPLRDGQAELATVAIYSQIICLLMAMKYKLNVE